MRIESRVIESRAANRLLAEVREESDLMTQFSERPIIARCSVAPKSSKTTFPSRMPIRGPIDFLRRVHFSLLRRVRAMQARTHINLRKLPLPSRGAIFDTVICLTLPLSQCFTRGVLN